MSIQQSMIAGYSSVPFVITNSGDFESANTEYLSRTQSGSQRKGTWSWWEYPESTGSNMYMIRGSTQEDWLYYGANTWAQLSLSAAGGSGALAYSGTDSVVAAGAWRHVCIHMDTDNATGVDRLKFYSDGVLQTRTGGGDVVVNYDSGFNSGGTNTIGYSSSSYDGLLSQFYWISDQLIAPTEFAYDASGTWTAKPFAGTYGSNDSYLTFDDSGALGADSSGNGNTWTNNNTVTQSATVPPFGNG